MRVSIPFLCAAAFAIGFSFGAPRAEAAAPETDATPSEWVGRYCTPTGCSGGPSSPLAHAASFGAAAATIGFLARRRRA